MAEFPAVLNLGNLNGNNGFQIDGAVANQRTGHSVSSAGDVNGDGIDDIAIGSEASAVSYVVFGSRSGFAPTLNLDSLNGTTGFRIDGAGFSPNAAGDINGDGIGDLIVETQGTGARYVLFGKTTGFDANVTLSALDGTNGFRLDGGTGGFPGRKVASAGDVNGDGIGDLIIGANSADPNDVADAGSSYVVFGSRTGFSANFDLTSLDGRNGFRLDSSVARERSGTSVSSAGDFNGDGIDDLIIGAPANNSGQRGSSYLVLGTRSGFSPTLNLGALDGQNGFRLTGSSLATGFSVSSAGDINGDGFDDLIIGAFQADFLPGGLSHAGASYVVFGHRAHYTPNFDLTTLDGSNGFRLDGMAEDRSGFSVSAAGDVNGDGFDDLIVGTFRDDTGANGLRGASYVVLGRENGFASTVSLGSLDGDTGFRLDGQSLNDRNGISVSGGGDFNGDGFSDVIVGAPGASTNAGRSGSSYVVFGQVPEVTRTGTSADNILRGGAGDDVLNGLAGNDELFGGAGDDLLNGGVGNDRLDGGTGADIMTGGTGDDTYIVDSVGDIVVERAVQGYDTVNATVSYTLTANVEVLNLQGTGDLSGTGNGSNNFISGTNGANVLSGGGGDDFMFGLDGNDTLDGGVGGDQMSGQRGNDTYVVDDVRDQVFEFGGEGIDTVLASISYALGNHVENLMLTGTANLTGTGNAGDNLIIGNAGDNRLDGSAGADRMEGGAGNDTYFVDDRLDVLIEATGGGIDTVYVNAFEFTLGRGQEVERIYADGQDRGIRLTGNEFANLIVGGAGGDRIEGGGGRDRLEGGLGDDGYFVDNAGVTIVETANGGVDTVVTRLNYTLGSHLENLILDGTSTQRGTGNALDNTITGNALGNVLLGKAGNDTLIGGLGADRLDGGEGADTFVFRTLDESTVAPGGRDLILGFTVAGADADRIDVSRIDANTGLDGNQRFTFIGTEAFSKNAGELQAVKAGAYTLVQGDVNGDGAADFGILLQGAPILSESHFVL